MRKMAVTNKQNGEQGRQGDADGDRMHEFPFAFLVHARDSSVRGCSGRRRDAVGAEGGEANRCGPSQWRQGCLGHLNGFPGPEQGFFTPSARQEGATEQEGGESQRMFSP